LRTNTSPALAVIEQVQPNPVKVSVPVDQTLADLNLYSAGITATAAQTIKTLRFASSVSSASYRFYIPPGQTVDPTAYFDLVFGNSSLLNYARSGLVVSINGQPIGSVRLSDATSAQSNNHVQINIPATVVIPGYNRLDIKATLIPTDVCVAPQLDGLWVTIWPDSNLHMPLVPSQVTPLSTVDLSAYPAPFSFQPTLATTAFVLPHDNLDAWRSALRIAGFLGNRSNGALFTLAAFYGDELKGTDRANYNLLVIGQPSQLPIVSEMNGSLPAPFDPSSDVAIEGNMQVKFNIPATSPMGYVQLFNSPWNQNNLVIAALGNSPQGVFWAASALVDAPLRSRLAGNFAAISGTQVVTTDTRLSPYATLATPAVGENVIPGVNTKLDLTPPPANQPGWILPALYLTSALILLVSVVAIVSAWLRSRKGSSS
jgi:cellulose synthase operon protein B